MGVLLELNWKTDFVGRIEATTGVVIGRNVPEEPSCCAKSISCAAISSADSCVKRSSDSRIGESYSIKPKFRPTWGIHQKQ
jgi:hypothetical protein